MLDEKFSASIKFGTSEHVNGELFFVTSLPPDRSIFNAVIIQNSFLLQISY